MAGDRKCANCGSPVGVLVDVCPSCGVDPDLQVLDLGVGRSRRRDRPATGAKRPGIGWKRWSPIVALVVVVWAFLAVTAGGDDDRQAAETPETTSTTERRRDRTPGTRRAPLTSTTVTLPSSPLLGTPTGLTLLVQGGRPRLIDLDTGVTSVLDVGDNVRGVAAGRLLISDNSGRLSWLLAPYDAGAEEEPLPRDVSDAWADRNSTVTWYLRQTDAGRPRVEAVGPDGNPLGDRIALPGGYPAGMLGDDLLIQAPGGTFLVAPDGSATMVSTGQPIEVVGDRAVVVRCEEALACFVEVVDRDGSVVVSVPAGGQLDAFGPFAWNLAASVDGRVAEVVVADDGSWRLHVDGAETGIAGVNPNQSGVVWSPDGSWLFVNTDEEGVLVVDGSTLTVATTIDAPVDAGWGELRVLEGADLQP